MIRKALQNGTAGTAGLEPVASGVTGRNQPKWDVQEATAEAITSERLQEFADWLLANAGTTRHLLPPARDAERTQP